MENQKVAALQPVVQTVESVGAGLGFAAQIAAQRWHADIATEAPACGARKGHALGGKSAVLQQPHDGALCSVSFLSAAAATGHFFVCLSNKLLAVIQPANEIANLLALAFFGRFQ